MNVKEWERQRKPRHPGPWYHTVQRGLVNVKIKCACFSRSILKVKSQQQEILILMPKVGQESGKDGLTPDNLEKETPKEPPLDFPSHTPPHTHKLSGGHA